MKRTYTHARKGLYILTILPLFLPWFTYNASIMGYCWGYQFLPFFLIPVCISGLYLFRYSGNPVWRILCRFSTLANLGILTYVLGYWHKFCNIRDGFQLADGLHTAQPAFWLTVFLHSAFFILMHLSLLQEKKPKEVSQ